MQASVIIRAKNEARFIGETLEAVFTQEGVDGFEVIIVDSGSTDGTLEIVRTFPVRLIQIPPEEFTYGRSLNLGIREACGEFVVSLSAHSLPAHKYWLACLLEPFAEKRVAGVYGRQYPREHATLLELAHMWISGMLDDNPRIQTNNPTFSNANGAFRRALCLRYPFDEMVKGAEDLAWARLVLSQGYVIAYQPTAPVYHSHGEPLPQHLRRAVRDQPTVIRSLLGLYPPRRDRGKYSRAIFGKWSQDENS